MAIPNEASVRYDDQARLLHDVERHLRPKKKPGRRIKTRSKPALRRIVVTVGLLWMVGLAGALSGTAMSSEGFRVDVLQQQLQQATRQQERLAGLLAAATSPGQLAMDAAALHVQPHPTLVSAPAVARPRATLTFPGRIQRTLAGLWRQLKALEAGGRS